MFSDFDRFMALFAIVISLVALFASIASALYTKKQCEIAALSRINDEKSYLSQNHEVYRIKLKEIRREYKQPILKLSTDAGGYFSKIGSIFDSVDGVNVPGGVYIRPLRHLIGDAVEMISYAFRGKLGRMSGFYISDKLYQLVHLEDNIEPNMDYFEGGNFRRRIKEMYFSDSNTDVEDILLRDIFFCGLVEEIKTRIDPSKMQALISKVNREIVGAEANLSLIKNNASRTVSEIEEVIEENNFEHFSLAKSPKILHGLKKILGKLDALSNMKFIELNEENFHYHRNYISIIIHNCTILVLLQSFSSWGWDEEI